jgi:CRP-like cAMP-binding protein
VSIQESIRKISFFNNLTDEQIDLIASISTESTYSSNSILYYESDVNNNFLFLVEGLIKIYKVDKFDN